MLSPQMKAWAAGGIALLAGTTVQAATPVAPNVVRASIREAAGDVLTRLEFGRTGGAIRKLVDLDRLNEVVAPGLAANAEVSAWLPLIQKGQDLRPEVLHQFLFYSAVNDQGRKISKKMTFVMPSEPDKNVSTDFKNAREQFSQGKEISMEALAQMTADTRTRFLDCETFSARGEFSSETLESRVVVKSFVQDEMGLGRVTGPKSFEWIRQSSEGRWIMELARVEEPTIESMPAVKARGLRAVAYRVCEAGRR